MSSNRHVALVSGGTFGIGRAVTLALARDGYDVTAVGIDEDQQAGLLALCDGLDVRAHVADVARAVDVRRVVDAVVDRAGRIDLLVNVAAITPFGTLLDTTEEMWDRVFEVNVKGMFLATKAVLPHMVTAGGGCILNFGSGAGHGKAGPRPGFAYSVSKSAVLGFTRSLALECARHHVRVNTIVPGGTHPVAAHQDMSDDAVAEIGRTLNVAGRWTTPEEVARAVVWLASDEALTTSGATFEIGTLPPWTAGVPPETGGPLAEEAGGRAFTGPTSYLRPGPLPETESDDATTGRGDA